MLLFFLVLFIHGSWVSLPWVQVTNSTRNSLKPETPSCVLKVTSPAESEKGREWLLSWYQSLPGLLSPNQGTGRCPLNSGLNQERKPPLPGKEGQKGALFLLGKGGPSCSRAAPSPPQDTSLQAFLTLFILVFSRQNSSSTLQTVLKICCVHNSKQFHGLFAKNKTLFRLTFLISLLWLWSSDFYVPFVFKPLLEGDGAVWIWSRVGTASLAPGEQGSPLHRGHQGSWRQTRHTLKDS